MNLVITDPRAIEEIEQLAERFKISASVVVERVMIEMGTWVPTELIGYPRRQESEANS